MGDLYQKKSWGPTKIKVPYSHAGEGPYKNPETLRNQKGLVERGGGPYEILTGTRRSSSSSIESVCPTYMYIDRRREGIFCVAVASTFENTKQHET